VEAVYRPSVNTVTERCLLSLAQRPDEVAGGRVSWQRSLLRSRIHYQKKTTSRERNECSTSLLTVYIKADQSVSSFCATCVRLLRHLSSQCFIQRCTGRSASHNSGIWCVCVCVCVYSSFFLLHLFPLFSSTFPSLYASISFVLHLFQHPLPSFLPSFLPSLISLSFLAGRCRKHVVSAFLHREAVLITEKNDVPRAHNKWRNNSDG
jgi:hypothetical protein